ncbi:MAG: Do family serine endopeptidase [Gammaproteobacteria bacterium]|nr:Do family serine endopeptidase [Gammaproteobacteria bacterium]MDE0366209.1 Do family serine endopeptidase [Gammaproteobacteria bacterium]
MKAPWVVILGVALAGTVARAAELPDFTGLVEAHSASVVNISSERRVQRQPRRPEELDDLFRRFFPGPGIPAPNVPRQSQGSGFIISSDGYILTNNHVVGEADEVVVRLSDRRELDATVVGADAGSDLALLKVEAEDLKPVTIGSSAGLKVGEWVLAIGSPFGFEYSVTAGIVSGKGRSLRNENYVPFIQSDVAINPGNSGGPLFNLDGDVVGINSQIYSNSGGYMGMSFAVPIDVAMEVADQLKASGRVSRGWLGVEIQQVNRELAESFGLEQPQGALITRVFPDSPGEEGGLLAGDIITEFNGQGIDRWEELPHYVGRTAPGSEARIGLVREGEKMSLELEIGELPDDSLAQRGQPGSEPSELGLVVKALPEAARERLELDGGVVVVRSEGPAAEAGIRERDIITRLHNKPVDSIAGFHEIANSLPEGRSVSVLLVRGERPLFVGLKVPE